MRWNLSGLHPVREQALAAGAVAFLRKPVNAELFADTLRTALSKSSE